MIIYFFMFYIIILFINEYNNFLRYILFLQSLRAKNNKSSCRVLRLRIKLQGANCVDLSMNLSSLVVEVKGNSYRKYSALFTGVLDYQKCMGLG